MAQIKGNRIEKLFVFIALSLASSSSVMAENWFIRDGTEQKRTDKLYFVGLIQPTYQKDTSDSVNGLQGDLSVYNGENTTLTNIGPSFDSTQSFYLFRVRFGVRGTAKEKINYEFVAEYGANALTTIPGGNANVELAEGSITFNHIPGARVRAGIFKVPGAEEFLRYAIEYINFTNATQFLFNTQPLEKVSDIATDVFVATPRSGVRAGRDTGVQVFDAFNFDRHEYSYAAMVGNGNTLNKTDDNDDLSLYGRIQYSYLFNDDAHRFQRLRPDITLFAWSHKDRLTFDEVDYDLDKSGFGLSLTKGIWQFNTEYMTAKGMLYQSQLFTDQVGGTLFAANSNEANGWYVDIGAFVNKNWLLGVRHDVFKQEPVNRSLEREFVTTTLAAQYYFSKEIRLAFNYEIRDYDYGNQALLSPQDASNITKIEDSVDNRIAVQLTLKI